MKQDVSRKLENLMNRLKEIRDEFESEASEVEGIKEVLEAEWDSRSEKWQESDTGQTARQIIDHLECAVSELATLYEAADSARSELSDLLAIA